MFSVTGTNVLPELEPPDVVAQIRTRGETGLGQVDQIAVDRRAVESLWCQVVDDVRVRHRGARLLEPPQHGEPRPRAAQPDGVNAAAQAVDRRACRRATWHVRKATPRRETAQRERALPRQPPWLARRRLLPGAWSVSRIAPPVAAGRASRYLPERRGYWLQVKSAGQEYADEQRVPPRAPAGHQASTQQLSRARSLP